MKNFITANYNLILKLNYFNFESMFCEAIMKIIISNQNYDNE